MKDLIEFMAKALVDDPSSVEVKEIIGEKVNVYELKVGKSDIGKVIGKKGKTVGAMRTILKAASTKEGKKADLEIVESEEQD